MKFLEGFQLKRIPVNKLFSRCAYESFGSLQFGNVPVRRLSLCQREGVGQGGCPGMERQAQVPYPREIEERLRGGLSAGKVPFSQLYDRLKESNLAGSCRQNSIGMLPRIALSLQGAVLGGLS